MLKIPPVQNWRKIVARGKYPLLLIYELNQGLSKTHLVGNFRNRLSSYCRISGGSYISETEAQNLIKELRGILRLNPGKILVIISDYYRQSKEFFDLIGKINRVIGANNLSKEELKKYYRQYERKIQLVWRWGYLPFLLSDAVELEINDLLSKLKVLPKDLSGIFKIIGSSPKVTLHQKEQMELLSLALKIKNQGLERSVQPIRNHLIKWGWKNSWVYGQYPLTEQQLKQELLNLIKKNPARLLRNFQKDQAKQIKARKIFLAKFKNKKLNILADILAKATHWHSVKIEEMTKAVYLAQSLFIKLAKQFDLSYEQFIELTPPEVIKEKIDLQVINARIKENGALMVKGKWQVLSPIEIKLVKEKLEEKKINTRTLKGFTAFPGKVKGSAKIVQTGINFSKIKINQGDILVTQMTTVNMTPLVKKAAAIVTDEGGILCHAAIISRELEKPCIIGTKFATKLFKDGDSVEVDANKGMVRKI